MILAMIAIAVLANLRTAMKDAGFLQATIRPAAITEERIGAFFWINAAVALLLGVVAAACGPWIVWIYLSQRFI